MASNITAMQWSDIRGILYTSITICSVSIIISTMACLSVLIVVIITPKLYSPTNLLVCSTSLCTLFYLIATTVCSFIFFVEPILSDWSCRIQSYLYYVSISLVISSYVIQAISRLFWTVLYKYRFLLTMKCHCCLIITKICISFFFPLSIIITRDVIFRPNRMCLVPLQNKLHVLYLLTICFVIPLLTIAILYAIIYARIAQSTANLQQSSHVTRRDAQLARNIVILVSIFVFGGIPTVICVIVTSKLASLPIVLFMIAITTPSVSVATITIVTIILNKDLLLTLKSRWTTCFPNCRLFTTRVQPSVHPKNNTNIKVVTNKSDQKNEQNETTLPTITV